MSHTVFSSWCDVCGRATSFVTLRGRAHCTEHPGASEFLTAPTSDNRPRIARVDPPPRLVSADEAKAIRTGSVGAAMCSIGDLTRTVEWLHAENARSREEHALDLTAIMEWLAPGFGPRAPTADEVLVAAEHASVNAARTDQWRALAMDNLFAYVSARDTVLDAMREGLSACDALRAENASLRCELDGTETTVIRQCTVLTRIANALKGAPAPLHSHSHHDLGEIVDVLCGHVHDLLAAEVEEPETPDAMLDRAKRRTRALVALASFARPTR